MEMLQGNAEKKPAWNMLSNGDSKINPVMGDSSWPSFSETAKTAPWSNKSSYDFLKCLGGEGSSHISFFSQQNCFFPELTRREQTFKEPIMDQGFIEQACYEFAITNGITTPPSGQSSSGYPLPYTSPKGQNQGNEFASQSHVGTQNQHQRNSNMSQNVSHHPRQSHGGRHNQEHVNQNWNPQRNSSGLSRFSQPPKGEFAHHSHRMPLPPPVLFSSQEALLKTKILNQVQYYLSEDNLPKDEYLRKRMNNEGFVHIEFIAGFNKLKTLTSDIQLILDSIQGSDVVEVKGYEIRNRHVWRKYLIPCDLQVPFYPSPKYA